MNHLYHLNDLKDFNIKGVSSLVQKMRTKWKHRMVALLQEVESEKIQNEKLCQEEKAAFDIQIEQ